MRFFHVVLGIVLVAIIGLTLFRAPNRLVAYALVTIAALFVALLPQVGSTTSGDLDDFDSLPWLAKPFADSDLLFGIYDALGFGLALAAAAVDQRFQRPALVNTGFVVMGDLRYDIEVPSNLGTEADSVYAVFANERPARLLRLSEGRPSLGAGEFCIRGDNRWRRVGFANLEQFFVTPERGREIEDDLSNMVAVVNVTGGCRAVLVDIEPQ